MNEQIVYMMNGNGADPAILKGLIGAGCHVRDTHSVPETLNSLRSASSNIANLLLVAEVQAGAIALLTLLRESGSGIPPTLLFDQAGDNIEVVIKALNLGVRDYLLASDPDYQRELCARVMAEQVMTKAKVVTDTPKVVAPMKPVEVELRTIEAEPNAAAMPLGFQWDSQAQVIFVDDKAIRLSVVESSMLGLLLANRARAVAAEDLVKIALMKDYPVIEEGVIILRPHMMRLRRKLDMHPKLQHRIVTVRGIGYMFI